MLTRARSRTADISWSPAWLPTKVPSAAESRTGRRSGSSWPHRSRRVPGPACHDGKYAIAGLTVIMTDAQERAALVEPRQLRRAGQFQPARGLGRDGRLAGLGDAGHVRCRRVSAWTWVHSELRPKSWQTRASVTMTCCAGRLGARPHRARRCRGAAAGAAAASARPGVRLVSLQEPWTEVPGETQELLTAEIGWVGADGILAPDRADQAWPRGAAARRACLSVASRAPRTRGRASAAAARPGGRASGLITCEAACPHP
jgi:hypothetical protein